MKEKFEPITPESQDKIDEMNALVVKFERTQKIEEYQQIKDMHSELKNKYHLKAEDIQTHVDVVSLMKQGFDAFPQIAHNDFAVDQMNAINAYQDNLNANIENVSLAQAFVGEVQTISEKLKDEYKDYWANPFAGVSSSEAQ